MSFNKIKSQYNQFIQTLKPDELTPYEIKLINLILDNFDSVASVGTAAGKRASLLNELINQNRDKLSQDLPKIEDETKSSSNDITRIRSIEIDNFRGFASKEVFDLDKPKVLVYGPNGSGKTSFCEALEYSLLGYLSEADAKRIDVKQYITNVHTEKSSQPILAGTNSKGEIIDIKVSPDSYYFCFIEKNRIIDFARYSSKTQGQQENLLATLFGLDEFYSFINGFTENISSKIPVESLKQKELDGKTQELAGQKQNIKSSTEKKSELEGQKKSIVENSKLNKTFDELDIYINGNQITKGRIALIDEQLQRPKGKLITYTTTNELLESVLKIEKHITLFEKNNTKFEQEKDKISFVKIFKLVQNFEEILSDKCPVCETAIEETKINPYDNARVKLKELEGIAKIQQDRDNAWNKLVSDIYSFSNDFESRKKGASELQVEIIVDIPEQLKNFQKEKSEHKKYIQDVKKLFENIRLQKGTLLVFDQKTMELNTKTSKHLESQKVLEDEKTTLIKLKKEIDDLKSNIKPHQEIISIAKKAVADFDIKNKPLIDEIAKEKIILEDNKKFIEAYSALLQKLNRYKKELPSSLVENLNQLTKEFYNFINRGDSNFELIEEIILPSNAGDNVKVTFQDNPEVELDAMHILSEGHTRCLGLSILLAKVVQDKLPFIIFDDIVNAIDDDHRGRIRELLFDNPVINERQIIITSHSEEYIKDIENKHFTKKGYKDECVLFTFLKPVSKTIRKKETTKHYLNKASAHIEEHSHRDCLMECRRALENLSNDLWRRASKKYVFQISYKVRAPFLPPDLMGIVNSLRKELKALKVSDFEKSLNILSWFIGLETSNNQVWNYLNKGTHEESDRDDFDSLIVEEVLNNLIQLETELHQSKK
ncbi:AAA family ATPase [Olleya sp. HaHaR_3_96]|uniref:AAA family ATPase n=1 Tax=Olleya sp. HaHaR_3_96 TaxID=2745560 RepID=UPI001C4E763E|nr:AAA family ATPase [Olleya sp. HaHaR_3_96]QXP59023.1 AAA family ATPase [Olleya sp. HaHaR_3_96]